MVASLLESRSVWVQGSKSPMPVLWQPRVMQELGMTVPDGIMSALLTGKMILKVCAEMS